MKKLFTIITAAVLGSMAPALAVTWEVTWPTDGKASSVDDVQIRCNEVAYRYLADDATATLLNAENETVKTLVRDDITLNFKGSYCTVDFEFIPAITEAGEYTISVPEATFSTTDGEESEAFTVSFTVESSDYQIVDATWTCIEPEDGKAEVLEMIMLQSDYAWDVVTENASAVLYNSSFEAVQTLTAADESFYPYGDLMIVMFNPTVTEADQYMLVIGEGSFVYSEAGVTNAEAYVELSIEESTSYEVSVMPEDNSLISTTIGIEALYINVSGYAYSTPNSDGVKMSITKDGKEFATVDASALGASMDHATALITLPEDAYMNTVGEYKVTIPEGYFYMTDINDESGKLYPNPEIVLTYTLTEPQGKLSWTISPEPGEVDELSTITITFNKAVKLALTPFTYLFFTNNSNMQDGCEGIITVSEDGLVATIEFDPAFKLGGIYQLRLFEGAENLAVVDGEEFPGLQATYKINAPLYGECTPSTEAELTSIENTKVFFRWNKNIAATDNFDAWYQNGDTKVNAELTKIYVDAFDISAPYVIVTPENEITTSGEWTLVFAEGSFQLTNFGETMLSPETTFTFNVGEESGISSLFEDNVATADVYNMQGMLIKKSATRAEMKALAPGFYIANGRKFMVK